MPREETGEETLRASQQFMNRHGDNLPEIKKRVLLALAEAEKVKGRYVQTEDIQEQCPDLTVDDVDFTLMILLKDKMVAFKANHKTKDVF